MLKMCQKFDLRSRDYITSFDGQRAHIKINLSKGFMVLKTDDDSTEVAIGGEYYQSWGDSNVIGCHLPRSPQRQQRMIKYSSHLCRMNARRNAASSILKQNPDKLWPQIGLLHRKFLAMCLKSSDLGKLLQTQWQPT